MESISKRIKEKRIEFGYTQSSLAKELNVTHTTISKWERSLNEPKGKYLVSLAETFKTSPEWITHGYIKKNIYRTGFELSSLIPFFNNKGIFEVIPNSMIGKREITKIKLYQVNGDTMSPLINHLSIVGVDTSNTEIIDGKTYLFQQGQIQRVKILCVAPEGINIISFKTNYPTEIVKKEEIEILGTIFWISNNLD